ncbi:MAG: hypothetical protein J6V99_05150 [Neisseriaceae bacterium]|nr:hypothetical protein [Neisseriaceae bacterium]
MTYHCSKQSWCVNLFNDDFTARKECRSKSQDLNDAHNLMIWWARMPTIGIANP